MDIELRHLRMVAEVDEAGSITRAASNLGLSQPALSAQISRVESALGGALFVRDRRGARPTALGSLVVDRARSLVEEMDALVGELERLSSGAAPIRLAANYSETFLAVLRQLLDLGTIEREVTSRINCSTTVLMREMEADSVDIGLLGVHPGYDAECPSRFRQLVVVEHEPFLIALSADHPLAGLPEITLADLASEGWLLAPGEPDGTDLMVNDAWAAAGIEPHAPFGRQRLAEFWPYVAAGRLVSFTLPTQMPAREAGVVVRPLVDDPVYAQIVVRWNPSRVSDAEARLVAQAALIGYQTRLEPARQRAWWRQAHHRPRLNDDLMAP